MKVSAYLYSLVFLFQYFMESVILFHPPVGVWSMPFLKSSFGIIKALWNWAFKGLRAGFSALMLLLEMRELLVQITN